MTKIKNNQANQTQKKQMKTNFEPIFLYFISHESANIKYLYLYIKDFVCRVW